ncbi:MAG: glucose-1-phosphate adenylyltransferase subunit GlgD, partial [Clostridia bacterium]|nr:glucose-1-phosphate adenylyltransferase subunit GlgD [Clostridia bacterium]
CFNIFVMRKTLLLNLLTTAMAHGATSFFKDIIQAHVGDMKIVGYEATGFAEMIDSLKTYYAVNMSLLNPENRESLFRKDNPIITKISDNVPATYGPECKVVNSLVADGCVIEGEVANSLLFRGVTVEKGAVVKNCILMQGTIVHSGAVLDSVIGDKNVTITNSRTLTGDPNFPIYITKNIQV